MESNFKKYVNVCKFRTKMAVVEIIPPPGLEPGTYCDGDVLKLQCPSCLSKKRYRLPGVPEDEWLSE